MKTSSPEDDLTLPCKKSCNSNSVNLFPHETVNIQDDTLDKGDRKQAHQKKI